MAITTIIPGPTATAGAGQTTAQAVTLPADVLPGDTVIFAVAAVPLIGSFTTISVTTDKTTVPVQTGPTENQTVTSASLTAAVYKMTVLETDLGATLTFHSTDNPFWAIALASYSSTAGAGAIDVINGQVSAAAAASEACPVLTTGADGDWALYLTAGTFEESGVTGPAGATDRVSVISGSLVAAAIYDSNGSVGAAGTSIGSGKTFSDTGPNALNMIATFTIGLAVGPEVYGTLDSTTGGVETWHTSSRLNDTSAAGLQLMRVLRPTSPSGSYAHAFLWMLPVETEQGTTFGDGIGTIQTLGAQNTYNLTCIQPGVPVEPWYADNPTDAATSQESFMIALAAWAHANLAVTGTERHYLIGFSKSGIGGQGLQFRNPSLFAATASWDAPFAMTDYDGTDPTFGGTVGGGSAAVYGTSANFTTNYELDSGNLTTWKNAANFGTVNRIWIGGFSAFQADVNAYGTALTTAGIQHTYTYSVSETHAWHTDWVAAALASIITLAPPATSAALLASAGII